MKETYLKEINKYLDEIDYEHDDVGVNKIIQENIKNKASIRKLLKGDDVIIGRTITHIEWSFQDCKDMAKIAGDDSLRGYFLNLRSISGCSPIITTLNKDIKEEILSKTPSKNRKKTSRILKVGTRISKLLNTSFKNYDLNLEYSKMVQEGLGMRIHLSVKPIDFLAMSDGKSWSSCHSMKDLGDYSAAGMTLSADKYALIAWAGINKYSKIWRQIWFVDTDGAFISSLPYPNPNKMASKTVESFLTKALSSKLNSRIVKQKGKFITKTFKKNTKGFFSDITVYCETREFDDKRLNRIGINAFAAPKYKGRIVAGGRYFDLVNGKELDDQIPYEPNNYDLYYDTKCDVCGRGTFSEETVTVNGLVYCEDCQGDLTFCDHCQDLFPEDDGVYVHIDGEEAFVCPECAEKFDY